MDCKRGQCQHNGERLTPSLDTLNYLTAFDYLDIRRLLDAIDNCRAANNGMYIGEKLLIFSEFPDVYVTFGFTSSSFFVQLGKIPILSNAPSR